MMNNNNNNNNNNANKNSSALGTLIGGIALSGAAIADKYKKFDDKLQKDVREASTKTSSGKFRMNETKVGRKPTQFLGVPLTSKGWKQPVKQAVNRMLGF